MTAAQRRRRRLFRIGDSSLDDLKPWVPYLAGVGILALLYYGSSPPTTPRRRRASRR